MVNSIWPRTKCNSSYSCSMPLQNWNRQPIRYTPLQQSNDDVKKEKKRNKIQWSIHKKTLKIRNYHSNDEVIRRRSHQRIIETHSQVSDVTLHKSKADTQIQSWKGRDHSSQFKVQRNITDSLHVLGSWPGKRQSPLTRSLQDDHPTQWWHNAQSDQM